MPKSVWDDLSTNWNDDLSSPYPEAKAQAQEPVVVSPSLHWQADTVMIQLLSDEVTRNSPYLPLISSIKQAFETHRQLTLKQANVVFWRLNLAAIKFEPTWFAIRLLDNFDRHAVKALTNKQIKTILPALDLEQRSQFLEMRFA